MERFLETVFISLQFIFVTTISAIGYGFFAQGRFTFAYVFSANFLVGTIIILVGLVLTSMPVRLRDSKLIDHTTYGQNYVEIREKKREKALEFIFLGMLNVVLTGIIQLVLSFVLHSP